MTKFVMVALPFLTAGSALADASDVTRALFSAECIRPLVNETVPNVDEFHAWSEQEVAQLSAQLGMQPDGFLFWTPKSTEDILIWSQSEPVCQVIHIGYSVDAIKSVWPALNSTPGFRSKPGSKSGSDMQTGGFGAISVPDNEFVQVTMQFQDFGQPGATLTMLTAVRVGQTPASCDLFPEECD